jgi:hypothetical protein
MLGKITRRALLAGTSVLAITSAGATTATWNHTGGGIGQGMVFGLKHG